MKRELKKRDIKFRGKRLDNNEWIIGSHTLIQHADGTWLETPDGETVQIDPQTLGQYTGCQSLECGEIYEDDMVYCYMDDPLTAGDELVYFGDDPYFGWMPFDNTKGNQPDDDYMITTNIHDNPDFLDEWLEKQSDVNFMKYKILKQL